jgi:hypothetical protein
VITIAKTLSLGDIERLLSTKKNSAESYMILDDGSKVAFNSSRVGSFSGRAGCSRKYYAGDSSVVAYKA